MAVTSNLIQGPARIFVASVGTTLPANDVDAASLLAGTFTGWSEVGHTTAGVQLVDTPTIVEARSQQAGRMLDAAVSQWDTTITSTAREVTLANLARLVHESVSGSAVDGGSNKAATKVSIAIVGPWGDGADCMIVAERAAFTSGLDMTFSSESYTELPFTITVLEGVTLPNAYRVYAL